MRTTKKIYNKNYHFAGNFLTKKAANKNAVDLHRKRFKTHIEKIQKGKKKNYKLWYR